MNKEQIEAESRLIQACKMIGATYKRDRIEFASGLVAKVTREDTKIHIVHPTQHFSILYTEDSVKQHYIDLLEFLYETDR